MRRRLVLILAAAALVLPLLSGVAAPQASAKSVNVRLNPVTYNYYGTTVCQIAPATVHFWAPSGAYQSWRYGGNGYAWGQYASRTFSTSESGWFQVRVVWSACGGRPARTDYWYPNMPWYSFSASRQFWSP